MQETSINQSLLYLRDDFQEILHGLYLISNVIRNELEVLVRERLDLTMVEYSLYGDLYTSVPLFRKIQSSVTTTYHSNCYELQVCVPPQIHMLISNLWCDGGGTLER